MLAIARYALKSPTHAATMVGVLAILSLILPFISVLSGAIVGLIILTQGLYSGARVILISIVGISIVSYLVLQSAGLGITIGLVQWLPIMVLAEVLRRTHSMSLTIVAGMVLAMLLVIAQYLFWPEGEKYLMLILQQVLQGAEQSGTDMQAMQEVLEKMMHLTVILLVAVMYSTFIATLMISRWFQSKLAGSEGYREEFYAIRLGQATAGSGFILIALAMLFQQDWLIAMMLVYLAAFLYQGLAIAHSWNASKKGKTITWLALLYVMMIIIPQVLGFISMLGVIDNWMDFRKKLKVS